MAAAVQKKRKTEDVHATFDTLRQAALNEHKLCTEKGDLLLKTIKEASAEFKQLLAAPKPAFNAYMAFVIDHEAALKSKKVKRHNKCSHPGCDAPFPVVNCMRGDVCEAGHHHHYCCSIDTMAIGAEKDCRACQQRGDNHDIGRDPQLIRQWNLVVKDLGRVYEPTRW